jgi:phage shock protein A
MLDDLKTTIRDGLREMRDRGDELARAGRLRMDIFQTERRLKADFAALGETVFKLVSSGQALDADDPLVAEQIARVKYYQGELTRLRAELERVL